MRLKKTIKFKVHEGEVVQIEPALKGAAEAMAEAARAASKAADSVNVLGATLKMYEHIFKPEAVGIQANEGGGGIIFATVGASLRAVYSTCKDLWKGDPALLGFEFPWKDEETEATKSGRYRKAAFYTEHRDGRSFSVRQLIKATATTIKVGKKDAVLRKAARYVRARRYLAPGWEIERVA